MYIYQKLISHISCAEETEERSSISCMSIWWTSVLSDKWCWLHLETLIETILALRLAEQLWWQMCGWRLFIRLEALRNWAVLRTTEKAAALWCPSLNQTYLSDDRNFVPVLSTTYLLPPRVCRSSYYQHHCIINDCSFLFPSQRNLHLKTHPSWCLPSQDSPSSVRHI